MWELGSCPPSVALTLVLDDTSDKSLRSLGLDSFGRSDFYIPLTAEMLSVPIGSGHWGELRVVSVCR